MRSSIQPLRRCSLPKRLEDDLLLHLRFENNLDDSCYWDQKVGNRYQKFGRIGEDKADPFKLPGFDPA